MGLTVLLQNQDITDFVDESTISFKSVLGQGTGSGGTGTGASSEASFLSDLGPIKKALGAGQTVPVTYPQTVLADLPMGYWRLDSQIDCLDVSGHSNNGTVQSGPLDIVTGATGDRNQGWETDGVAYVQTPLALTATNNFTLEALVNLIDSFSHGPITRLGTGSNGYGWGIGDNTTWNNAGDVVMVRVGSNFYQPASPIHVPRDGRWHLIAMKVVGTTASIYLDSALAGTATIPTPTTPTGNGYIGATPGGPFATGMAIDDVAWYATALADARMNIHFNALGVAPALVRGGEVIIKDATGTVVFGGEVTDLKDASDALNIKTELDCVDYFQALDRIEVNEVFLGDTDIDIIRFIITNYAPDILLTDIPMSGTFSFAKRYVRAKSVKDALIEIAKITGYAVWVTPDKKLKYKAPTDVSTAPFTLSDEPDFVNSFGYDITEHTQDDNGIINRVYFYGGKQASPDFTQDLRPQANNANKVFQLAYYPNDATDGSVHVRKNGVELAVGSPFGTDKLVSDGGTKDVLLNRDAMTLTFDTAPNNVGLTELSCTYRYSTPLVVTVSDRSSFQFFGKWYDGKLDDSTVLDASTAIQRARVLLSQQAYGLESLKVVCHTGGLQAGQLLRVVNDLREIDDTYLVQSVTAKPEGAGYFEYTVALGAWNWNLVDLLFAVARRAGVQDTATEEDLSVVQAQETLEAGDIIDIITVTTTTSGQYFSGHFYSGFATIIS